jgi:hypothetical protein
MRLQGSMFHAFITEPTLGTVELNAHYQNIFPLVLNVLDLKAIPHGGGIGNLYLFYSTYTEWGLCV